jgi:CrcB protein
MRPAWDRTRVIAVAAGGVVGATVRWAVLTSWDPAGFPWPVFVVNIVGSVLLGVLLAEEAIRPARRVLLHDAGAIGFCGGLTTFSTFSVEVVELTRDGDTAVAVSYGVLSVLAAIVGVMGGAGALRRLRAVSLPVEEEP